MADPTPDLVPPRPFFLAATRPRRSASSDSPPVAPPSSFAFPFQAYPGNPDPLPTTYGRRRVSLESLNAAAPGYESDSNTLPRVGSLVDLHKPTSSSSLYRASAAAPIALPQRTATPPLSPAQVFRPPFLSPASRPISSLSWAPPILDYAPPPVPTNGSSTALHLSPSASTLAVHRPPLPSTMLEKSTLSAAHSQISLNSKDGKDTVKPVMVHQHPKRHRASWWITFTCVVLGIAGAAALCYTGVQTVKSTMLDESQLCLVMQEDFADADLNDAFWSREVQVDDRGFQISTSSPKNLYLQNGQLYIFPTLTRDDTPEYAQDGQTYAVDGCTAQVPAVVAPAPATNSTDGTGDGGNGGNATATTTTSAVRGGGTAAVGTGNGNGGNTQHNRRQTQTNGGNSTSSSISNSTTTTPSSGVNQNITAQSGVGAGNLCTAVTNAALGTVINPVLSGRITTRGKVGMKYGRVQVVAKVARGDWLWPAIWMLPENDTYGAWPLSGEIDILETRGNGPSYPAQGSNYLRSALAYGLDSTLTPIEVPGAAQPPSLTKSLFGWFALKRTSFDKGFHTYTLEWDEKFIRFWVDGAVRSVLDVGIKPAPASSSSSNPNNSSNGGGGTFWEKGKFPATAQNKTTGTVVVVEDPWVGGGAAAPFDQRECD
ncbi:hypothetical protein C0991_006925 [Blastosporella zonata]|nr:hypothetical protein C0991_006925 [Blastosporella zonata]